MNKNNFNYMHLVFAFFLILGCTQTEKAVKYNITNVKQNLDKQDNTHQVVDSKDYSPLWLQSPTQPLGIIGDDHQRLYIAFNSVHQDQAYTNKYHVSGTSKVKNNSCDFTGYFIIEEDEKLSEMHYGVDDEYKDKGIKAQGILKGSYHLEEDKNQDHSGVFEGKFTSIYYVDKNGKVQYDDIRKYSDNYKNNQFEGRWTSHETGKSKLANWGDYRIPGANKDFDIGAAEFSPSEKYLDKGWEEFIN